jgi:hypothetical protein
MLHARRDYQRRIQDSENKIGKDEPVFLLRAKDKFAPAIVRIWAGFVLASGDKSLGEYIMGWSEVMEDWQARNGCKCPDLPEVEKIRTFL